MEKRLLIWSGISSGFATAFFYFVQGVKEIMSNPWIMALYFVMTWVVMYVIGYFLYRKAKPKIISIVIPVEGWKKNENDTSNYPWFVDIPNKIITTNMVPFVTLDNKAQAAARHVGFSTTAETVNGALRLFSSTVPEEPLTASATLFDAIVM